MDELSNKKRSAIVVGAGFTGLSAAYELAAHGYSVSVLEAEEEIGGLSRAFETSAGTLLDRIYHIWFTSDSSVVDLVIDMGMEERLIRKPINMRTFTIAMSINFQLRWICLGLLHYHSPVD